jgi:hypothetical protein
MDWQSKSYKPDYPLETPNISHRLLGGDIPFPLPIAHQFLSTNYPPLLYFYFQW